MPCADQAELLEAFDLPIALMQDAEALERITARAGRDQGRRERPLHGDPLGPAAPRRGRPAARGRDRGGRARAPRRRAARTGIGRPAHLHRAALARPRRERRPRRDRGPLPRPGPDRLGPRRTRRPPSRIPRQHARRVRGRAGRRPADHPPCRGVGRRGAGPPRARDGPGADRPRPRHHRRPGALRRAGEPRRDAGPVPHLERAGRDRRRAAPRTRSRGCTARACR